jgi:arylsulfatase A-like enzyme
MDPHAPYYPTGQAMDSIGARAVSASRMRYLNSYWNRRDLGPSRLRKYRDAVLELYDSSIRWIDTQMSRLVKLLEDLNVWDRCVLAVTADHGEEFLEHDATFHAPWTMREELIRVPLLVRHPASAGGEVTRWPFSHVDLTPTLMDAINVPVARDFQGRSRWHSWQQREDWNEPVVVESTECLNPNRPETRLVARVLCVREERYKLILRFGAGKEELFDLRNDRAETNPLPAKAELPVRRRLLESARGHIERTRRTDRSALRLRARLRDLRFQLPEPTPVTCGERRQLDAVAHSLRG